MPGTASAADITTLRRMIAESGTATYTDVMLQTIIQEYPVPDINGDYPYTSAGSVNADWTSTFDLARAAAYVWTEKAAAIADRYAFTADGATFQRNQAYEQYMKQATFWNARRKALGRPLATDLGNTYETQRWIANWPEEDD